MGGRVAGVARGNLAMLLLTKKTRQAGTTATAVVAPPSHPLPNPRRCYLFSQQCESRVHQTYS